MNKQEFMSQLESLLLYLPTMEREEALQYYSDYFEDAGVENEQEVIASLGDPAKVAENIKNDFYRSHYDDMEPSKVERGKELVNYHPQLEKVQQPYEKKEKKKMSTEMIVLIIVLCIFLSPVIVALGAGIIGILAGILGAIASIIVALVAMTLSFFGVGLTLIVIGIIATTTNIMAGIGVIGCGLILVALGFLFLMLFVLLVGKLIPMICKGIAKLFRRKKRV